MIVKELEAHEERIVVVRFNPWRFQSESYLLKNFFQVLADRLGKSMTTRGEKVSKFFRDYVDVLTPISLLGVDPSKPIKALTNIRPEADLEELKSRIEEALTEADQRVVIIMDDIDRLDKDEIQAVFKLVKLSADFPNTAYILAFDEEMVAHALKEKYGTARHVIKELFPRMGGIDLLGGSIYGPDWQPQWSKQKRIAATDYFDRYFSYGVPPNDFSDRRADEFLSQIEIKDVGYVVQEIRTLATGERAGVFLSKLGARIDKVTPTGASRLAQGLALCGEVFPNTGGVPGTSGRQPLRKPAF